MTLKMTSAWWDVQGWGSLSWVGAGQNHPTFEKSTKISGPTLELGQSSKILTSINKDFFRGSF